MSLNYEMARYTELTGEDGTKVPISRLGGFLDGYEKGRAEIQSELMAEVAMLNETKMNVGDLKCFAYRIKAIAEQSKEQSNE